MFKVYVPFSCPRRGRNGSAARGGGGFSLKDFDQQGQGVPAREVMGRGVPIQTSNSPRERGAGSLSRAGTPCFLLKEDFKGEAAANRRREQAQGGVWGGGGVRRRVKQVQCGKLAF